MRVAACQTADVRDDVPRALDVVGEMATRAHADGADVILFPECFLQGYFTDVANVERLAVDLDGSEVCALRTLSSQVPITLVVGVIEQASDGNYNSAAVLQNGELVARYRKRRLLAGESQAFQPGGHSPVVKIADRRVGFSICYDLRFAECAAEPAALGAEVLLCPCNNMLSRANAEAWKARHNAIRGERCREAGLWLVSADVTGERDGKTSYGPTAVLNPSGQVLDQVPLLTEGMLIVDI